MLYIMERLDKLEKNQEAFMKDIMGKMSKLKSTKKDPNHESFIVLQDIKIITWNANELL